jgi:hypothetical protein
LITRSIVLPVSYDQPSTTRDAITEATDAGFAHIILGLPAPCPDSIGQWVADEIITSSEHHLCTGPVRLALSRGAHSSSDENGS